MTPRAAALWTALLTASLAGPARAQSTGLDPIAVAQALADDGRKLMAEGKIDAACHRFEEAVRLVPAGIGALAQLAECHEKAGRLSRAWAMWIQVEGAASRAGQGAREREARARAQALSSKVPRIAIEVPNPPQDIAVSRDGEALPSAQWGLSLPVDPGRHAVRVTAPGRVTWTTQFDLQAGEIRLIVPALPVTAPDPPPAPPIVRETKPPPPPAPPPLAPDTGRAQRRAGIALGAAGIAALHAAGVLLAVNLAKNADYDACQSCWGDPDNPLLRQAAATRTGAVVSAVAGAAILGSAVAVYMTAPSPRHRISLQITPSGAQVTGRW